MRKSGSWRMRALAASTVGLAACGACPAAAEWRLPASHETRHALAAFAGEGTERNFTDTLHRLGDFRSSSDRLVAAAYGRTLARHSAGLSLEAEVMYGRHYGRESYHEVGAALNLRWEVAPLRQVVAASLAIGLGPSYTTIHPELERQDSYDDRSRVLNQLNLEATLAHPAHQQTELLVRLQHRSGVFGLFGGVTDASNFLTVGLRHRF